MQIVVKPKWYIDINQYRNISFSSQFESQIEMTFHNQIDSLVSKTLSLIENKLSHLYMLFTSIYKEVISRSLLDYFTPYPLLNHKISRKSYEPIIVIYIKILIWSAHFFSTYMHSCPNC